MSWPVFRWIEMDSSTNVEEILKRHPETWIMQQFLYAVATRSSAQSLRGPGMWETDRCTWCWKAMLPSIWRNTDAGHRVVKDLLIPASAAVLSDADGKVTVKCRSAACWQAAITSATWAKISNAQMYFCGCLVSCGRNPLS